jgi:hypothetical protein
MFYGPMSGVQLSYNITLIVTLWATIATHLWAKITKNGWKLDFEDTYLHNVLIYTQIYSMGNKWCSTFLWYHPRCLLHSRSHIVTLRVTIASHLWAKMADNGWKQFFDENSYPHLLFYTQICSLGQWVVFNCPMLLPKVPTTLLTPYSYPSHSLSKNSQKWLKTGFWGYLPP